MAGTLSNERLRDVPLNFAFPLSCPKPGSEQEARSSLKWFAGLAIAAGIAFFAPGPASAQPTGSSDSGLAGPQDPVNQVNAHEAIRERDALFEPAGWSRFYERLDAVRGNLYKSTGLKPAFYHSTLYQNASASLPGQGSTGLTTITGLYGTWDLVKRGDPSAGQLSFGIEGRWGYGNRLTATELGNIGIGSATGTADPYGKTQPVGVLRELFWRGGSAERGWEYRIGKFTPDRSLATSKYINPISMFLPAGSEGAPAIAFPDSGLGLGVGVYPTERFRFGIIVADANGDRTNFGDIGEGNFFKAVEFQAKLFPITKNAGFSTLSIWHTDGTDDPDNAKDTSTGESGWGYFVKFEQELSRSGNDIGMIRFGHSYDGAAIYKEQGSIRYVRLDPPDPFGLKDDVFGIAASYVKPLSNPFDRDEWGIDAFYRFNLLERIEATLAYQVIFNPTYNPNEDEVGVVSFRLTQFF